MSRELEPLPLTSLPFCDFDSVNGKTDEGKHCSMLESCIVSLALTSLILKCSFCFALLSNSFKNPFTKN